MSGVLEAIQGGAFVTVQDLGRFGYRSIGVPVSGALDPVYLRAANALLNNEDRAAGLEIPLQGPVLRVIEGPVRVSLVGAIKAEIKRDQGRSFSFERQTTVTLFKGDTVSLGQCMEGIAYMAFSQGLSVPSVLGSRSTFGRAGFGGIEGRPLAAGDKLTCGVAGGDPWLESRTDEKLGYEAGPIRIILGPQEDHFHHETVSRFFGTEFTVTQDMDRMGIRLTGRRIMHNEKGADIVSDSVVPGSIQIPASGEPIILLADCQTSGGYAKIATVIRSDLPRLAHLRPGMTLRFQSVKRAEAIAARRQQERRLLEWVTNIETYRPPGWINEEALRSANLISGAVSAKHKL